MTCWLSKNAMRGVLFTSHGRSCDTCSLLCTTASDPRLWAWRFTNGGMGCACSSLTFSVATLPSVIGVQCFQREGFHRSIHS